MKSVRRILFYLLQFSWGIIQNLMGAILFLALFVLEPEAKKEFYHGALVFYWKNRGSLSLGMFIFFGHSYSAEARQIITHEYGHSIQSLLLGPFYLAVIGLPSLLWSALPQLETWRRKNGKDYYWLYCESWANFLGNKFTKDPAPTV